MKIEPQEVRLAAQLYHETKDDAVLDCAAGRFQVRQVEAAWNWYQGYWHLKHVKAGGPRVDDGGYTHLVWYADAEGPDHINRAPAWLLAWAVASEPQEAPAAISARDDRRGGQRRCPARDARTGNRCTFDPAMTSIPPERHTHRDGNGAQFTKVRPT